MFQAMNYYILYCENNYGIKLTRFQKIKLKILLLRYRPLLSFHLEDLTVKKRQECLNLFENVIKSIDI